VTGLLVTGAGVVSAAGFGLTALTAALAAGSPLRADVTGLFPQPLPYRNAPVLASFDARTLLGRKGTGSIDRATALSLVACGQAIEDSGLPVAGMADRVGIALGTTVGSLSSSSEYSRETLVAERPYLVNPMLFPNTVMNCAAGHAAIRYGLRGVNSTVAGGQLAFLGALRYAVNVLRRDYADAMLVGAVEEFSPHSAWAHQRLGHDGPPGEAAIVVVLQRPGPPLGDGRRPLAELAAVTSGYRPGGHAAGLSGRMAACVRQTLAQAGLQAGQVGSLAVSETGGPESQEIMAEAEEAAAPGGSARQVRVGHVLGDCGAAASALQFAALLASFAERPADGPPARPALLAGWSQEGAFGAAVIREPAASPAAV
jgi:3-oxoacyl-[acyl-carrier-protein] synthase II